MSILQQPILVATTANDGVLGAALVLTGIVLAMLFAVALHTDRNHRTQAGAGQVKSGAACVDEAGSPATAQPTAALRPRGQHKPQRPLFKPVWQRQVLRT